MKLRISEDTFIWFLIAGIILKPFSIGYILPTQFDKIWDYLRVVTAVCLALYYIWCRYEVLFLIEFVSYQIFVLIVTVWLAGDVKTCFIYTIMYAELVMITIVGTHRKRVMYGMYMALVLICGINFLTIIGYPTGLYVNGMEWQNWYLGYRSSHIIYLLPCMVLSDLYYRMNKKMIYKVIHIICFLQPFLVWSAGAIVCMVIYEAIKLLDQKFYMLSKIKMRTYAIGWIALSYLLTKGYIIESFKFLIVKILHRNISLTGRTIFWGNFWNASMDNPILGHGNEYDMITAAWLGAPYGHNFLLNLFYVGGIAALILFLYVFFIYSHRLKNVTYDKEMFRYVLAGLISFMTMGLTESLEDMGAFAIAMTLLASICISRENFSNIWRLDND